jgi:hypothetical protein
MSLTLKAEITSLARETAGDRDQPMRLLDQIAQARQPLQVVEEAGIRSFPSARDYAAAVTACPTRFVMDQNAADQCFALLESDHGMLSAENSFLRVPMPGFWLEWPCPPSLDAGTRTGLLVEADEDGRAGRITTFWEQASGEPVPAQAVVEFDLDGDCIHRAAACEGLVLTPGLHPLAPNLLFKIDAAWLSHIEQGGITEAQGAIRSIASNLRPGIEFLFVFSALLCERTSFDQQAISLAPLNRHRAKRGKPALLDHVEVKIDLNAHARYSESRVIGAREAARLHHVRGHMVDRGGALFWRRSHLRGDATRLVSSRTVSVTTTGTRLNKENRR